MIKAFEESPGCRALLRLDRQSNPATKNDDKTFFMSDCSSIMPWSGVNSWSRFYRWGASGFGSPQYNKVWESYFKQAVLGQASGLQRYATDPSKQVRLSVRQAPPPALCFSPTVTYPDNTTQPAELAILPYPVEGGVKQPCSGGRGHVRNQVCKRKRAHTAVSEMVYQPENNLRFVSSPATSGHRRSFWRIMSRRSKPSRMKDQSLLSACKIVQQDYEFFIPPLFEEAISYRKDTKPFRILPLHPENLTGNF